MKSFEDLVKTFVEKDGIVNEKYSPNGKIYHVNGEYFEGDYWYYECEDFIIDIHDFHIKKEYIATEIPDMSPYMYLISNFLISGSGEWLDPYQSIEPRTILIMCTKNPGNRYILHAGSRFHMVGMKFKEGMIEKYFVEKKGLPLARAEKIFLDTRKDIIHPIEKIAEEIKECRMSGLSADLFFDAKAKEWLSIVLNASENHKKKVLPQEDKYSLERVASYINDHYSHHITQAFLEKIAMMSGTKLKNSFKKHFDMSITEYIQRKRINVAENLLLNGNMEIRDVAKSVGYSSASRFSTLFKRYKGILPHETRKSLK